MLKPYARNARTHSERQIALIAQSMETFGFNNPILAEEGGTIIAGHGRWEAAKHLALKLVPILRARHLTPEKIRAYRLADNRLAELNGWDAELQAIELGALSDFDLDFSIETIGWTHAEIDVMLDSPEAASGDGPRDAADEDIPMPPVTPVSAHGDLWTLGEHRLLVGSSLADVDRGQPRAGHEQAKAEVAVYARRAGGIGGLALLDEAALDQRLDRIVRAALANQRVGQGVQAAVLELGGAGEQDRLSIC